MKQYKILNWLVPFIAVLALITSGVGLFWLDSGEPVAFTTLHGQEVTLYGKGLYRFDTMMQGATNRGTDAVALFIEVPLLVIGFLGYRRGSLRGSLLLLAMLGLFLYLSVTLATGIAYNSFMLLYILYFSASLFAFIIGFHAIDLKALPRHITKSMPHRGLIIFCAASGFILFTIWGVVLVDALMRGVIPDIVGPYSTVFTFVIDMGVIAPALMVTAWLLSKRTPIGYPLAAVLLIACVVIGLDVIAQTVVQILEGVFLPIGQLIGFVGSFVILAAIATALLVRFFNSITEKPAAVRKA